MKFTHTILILIIFLILYFDNNLDTCFIISKMLYINFLLIYISNHKLRYKLQNLKLLYAFVIGLFLFVSFKSSMINSSPNKYLVNGHEFKLESSSKSPISSFKTFRHKKLNKTRGL